MASSLKNEAHRRRVHDKQCKIVHPSDIDGVGSGRVWSETHSHLVRPKATEALRIPGKFSRQAFAREAFSQIAKPVSKQEGENHAA